MEGGGWDARGCTSACLVIGAYVPFEGLPHSRSSLHHVLLRRSSLPAPNHVPTPEHIRVCAYSPLRCSIASRRFHSSSYLSISCLCDV